MNRNKPNPFMSIVFLSHSGHPPALVKALVLNSYLSARLSLLEAKLITSKIVLLKSVGDQIT